MDHPLRSEKNKILRGRVVDFLKNDFSIMRDSNIIFVCGGSESDQMRSQFEQEFQNLLPKHEFFKPEFAMVNYFGLGDSEPFDIVDFERLVGDLSLAIVLFPEAAGSYAELGYFSGQTKLARKIVLVLDIKYQKFDSFISLGPASKIANTSKFRPTIQMDYKNPDFSLVSTRILERAAPKKTMRKFEPAKFSELSAFELFALIHKLVAILIAATPDDIVFFLRSMFEGRVTSSKIKKVISILVGSGRLREVGDFGHLVPQKGKDHALVLQDGNKTFDFELKVMLSAMLSASSTEFSAILGDMH